MPGHRRDIISAVAQTAVATLLTGPMGGLSTAAGQVIAIAAGTQHGRTYEKILKDLHADLDAFADAENVPDALITQALMTAELAIRDGGASVAECLDLQLDPQRIANRVLGRASALLADLDDGAADICRKVVRLVYGKILAEADALPGLEREFQRHLVSQLADLSRLPEKTANAVRNLAAAAVVTDPRQTWRADLFPESALVRAACFRTPAYSQQHSGVPRARNSALARTLAGAAGQAERGSRDGGLRPGGGRRRRRG